MKTFLLCIVLFVLFVNTSEELKTIIEENVSIDILRTIFEFLNHDDFMEAIQFYNLTPRRLDGLKVAAAHKRIYGTQILEYYGGNWKYDVNGILFPFKLTGNIKQMAMVLYEPPMYVCLYNNGNLEVKAEKVMKGNTHASNIDSFFIRYGTYQHVAFLLDVVQNNGGKHIGKPFDASYGDVYKSSEFRKMFYVPFSTMFSHLILGRRLSEIYFYYHEFDVNNFTDRTYVCAMKSSLFDIERNLAAQITNIFYSGVPIDTNMIKNFHLSKNCTQSNYFFKFL